MDRLWRFYSSLICSAAQTLQQVLQAILEQFLRLHRLRLSLLASAGRLAPVGRRRLLGRPRLTLERLAVDRKSAELGTRVSVRVDLGGSRVIKKNKTN